MIKKYYWVEGTEENGEPWEAGILFEYKETAIKYAKFQNKIKKFKEIHVEQITETKERWKTYGNEMGNKKNEGMLQRGSVLVSSETKRTSGNKLQ